MLSIPVEVLQLIFKQLDNKDLRTCKLVNRTWNKSAQLLVKEYIHLNLDVGNAVAIFNEFSNYPLLAPKITKVTYRTSAVSLLECINLCTNILMLTVDNPHINLTRLIESDVELTKLEEIKIVSRSFSRAVASLHLACCKKYKDTISTLELEILDEHNIPDFSIFSKLRNLRLSSRLPVRIKLDQTLLANKSLESLVFVNICVDSSQPVSRIPSCLALPTSKIYLTCVGLTIHINALVYIIEIASKIELLLLNFNDVETNPHQTKEEAHNMLEQVTNLPIHFLVVTIRYDSRDFVITKFGCN